MIKLIYEGLIVGIITLIMGLITKYILEFMKIKNIYLLFFILGVYTHFFFELIGLNKLYCTHGYSCMK